MLIKDQIQQKLQQRFNPTHLEVINESTQHHVPAGSESHFKVIVVSTEFQGLALLQRHRLINEVLAEELASSIHALAIHTLTPEEWASKGGVNPTPNCRGGFAK